MKLKNKVMSSITALAAAMVMMAGMTIPAYANIDQAAADAAEAEAETETVIEETQPEPDEETPAYERTYRDGSLQNECWSEKGYTFRERDRERRTEEDD